MAGASILCQSPRRPILILDLRAKLAKCHGFYPCGGIACVRLRLILQTLVSHVIGYALTLISHANGYALTHYVTLLTV